MAAQEPRNAVDNLAEIVFARPQGFLGAFLVVDVGGRTDEFEDFSFCIAQDHGLLEVPAIGPVLSAERPGFERKTLSRMHALPKALGCFSRSSGWTAVIQASGCDRTKSRV